MNFKKVKLSNRDYFRMFLGKRVLKTDIFNSKGKIPVISANVFSNMGYTENTFIKSFENNFVIWGIDGNFDFNFIKKGKKFMPTDHCGCLEVINNDILPEYLLFQLEENKKNYGFDRGLRASLKSMSSFEIDLPILENGKLDVESQNKLIQKYRILQEIRKDISKEIKKLEEIKINILKEYNLIKKPLFKLFKIKQGNAYYTKKRILGNKWSGDVPVYSSNTKENGLLMNMDFKRINENDLYHQYCLTWSVDGYAGTLFVRNENNLNNEKNKEYFFTINNHCGILLPLEHNLYLPYIKNILQPIFYEKSKGYGNNKVGTNQIKDILVEIPINKDGNYDFEKQKIIAEKYIQIEKIKENLINELYSLINLKINFN